jgi:hypothetical protein
VLFVVVEGRVKAPLVDLKLLRNQILVGATLAILIVAGTINALMYVLSLYFQNPSAFGMSALETGFATLPAAAAMILVTPLITPIAVKIGTRFAIVAGFGLSAIGFGVLAFVQASWAYAAFIAPLAVIAAGLGLANGPASSASTSAVPADQVGQASGISNMARYIGGSLAVRRRHRHGLQLGDRGSPEERSVPRGRPRRSPLTVVSRDGDPRRAGYCCRHADGAPPPATAEGNRPRRGRGSHGAHDSDPAAERLSLFAR